MSKQMDITEQLIQHYERHMNRVVTDSESTLLELFGAIIYMNRLRVDHIIKCWLGVPKDE